MQTFAILFLMFNNIISKSRNYQLIKNRKSTVLINYDNFKAFRIVARNTLKFTTQFIPAIS